MIIRLKPSSTRSAVTGGLLCLGLFATACGGGDANSVTAGADETDVAEAIETAEAEEPSEGGSNTNAEAKTLDDYLGQAAGFARGGGGGGRGGRAAVDDQAEQDRLVQVGIQRCMQEQGFTYFPEEQAGLRQIFVRPEGAGLSPQDYAATEGFGISTRFDALLEGDIDLSEDTSPNDEHLETLSEGEVEAWQFALRGAPPERNDQGQLIDPETGDVIQGRGRIAGGCRGDAQTEVRGDFSVLQDLADEFAALEDRIDADPRIAQIRRDWSDCMREAGYDYEEPGDARAEITEEVQPLMRGLFRRGPNAANDEPLSLTPEQETELKALQDRERTVAIASLECDAGTQEEVAEITARYEAEFVEQNRSQLEAFSGAS